MALSLSRGTRHNIADEYNKGLFGGLFKPNIKKLEEKKDVEGLVKALEHSNGDVREGTALALRKTRDGTAVEQLMEALNNRRKLDQKLAIKVLRQIGDNKAVGILSAILLDKWKNPKASYITWELQEAAGEALGEIGSREAAENLREALKLRSKTVRNAAYKALKDIVGEKEADEALDKVPSLKRERAFKRSGLKRVEWLKEQRDIDELARLLDDALDLTSKISHAYVRRVPRGYREEGYPFDGGGGVPLTCFVVRALGEIAETDRRAAEPLIEAMDNRHRPATSMVVAKWVAKNYDKSDAQMREKVRQKMQLAVRNNAMSLALVSYVIVNFPHSDLGYEDLLDLISTESHLSGWLAGLKDRGLIKTVGYRRFRLS